MSNNTVHVSGKLEISAIAPLPIGGETVSGYVYTGHAALGQRHPFVATGQAAQRLLAKAKELNQQRQPADIGAVMHAKLVSQGAQAYLGVLYVGFHDITSAQPWAAFATNSVVLSGHLTIYPPETLALPTGPLTGLTASLATDRAGLGGQHHIAIVGAVAERLLRAYPALETTPLAHPGTVSGELLSFNERILVRATWIGGQAWTPAHSAAAAARD